MKKLLVCIAIAAFSTSAFASRYLGVKDLGSTKLSYGNDRDSLMVSSCNRGFMVDSIKIQVTKNNANIDYITVHFGNGGRMDLPVRSYFPAGSQSRWVDLGRTRCIRSLEIYGQTAGLPIQKTKVRFLGRSFSMN